MKDDCVFCEGCGEEILVDEDPFIRICPGEYRHLECVRRYEDA